MRFASVVLHDHRASTDFFVRGKSVDVKRSPCPCGCGKMVDVLYEPSHDPHQFARAENDPTHTEALMTDAASHAHWKEDMHPRDPDGKFAKKGSAHPGMVKMLKEAGFAKHPENQKQTELYHHESGHSIGFNPVAANAFVLYLKSKFQKQAHGVGTLQELLNGIKTKPETKAETKPEQKPAETKKDEPKQETKPTSRPAAILAELDKQNAPDIEYSKAFSTYSKTPLKKGETWRQRLVNWVKSESKEPPTQQTKTEQKTESTPSTRTKKDPSDLVKEMEYMAKMHPGWVWSNVMAEAAEAMKELLQAKSGSKSE